VLYQVGSRNDPAATASIARLVKTLDVSGQSSNEDIIYTAPRRSSEMFRAPVRPNLASFLASFLAQLVAVSMGPLAIAATAPLANAATIDTATMRFFDDGDGWPDDVFAIL
jgi:hypothetical protein